MNWIVTKRNAARLGACGLLLAVGAPALAQDDGPASVDHLAALRSCQGVADAAARLACFDRTVATMVAATEQGELQLVDKEEVTKTRRRLFGFSLPDLGIFKGPGGGEDDELSTLQSTITRIVSIRRDTVVFEIEEGSIWQMNNAPAPVIRQVEAGAPVEFKKAALGSYFIRVNGRMGVKGKRIE